MADEHTLNIDGTRYETEVPEGSLKPRRSPPDPRIVRAFIPGLIQEVRVREGDRVEPGEVLLLLDAMKMYNEVVARVPARVKDVQVEEGEVVEKDQLLVELA
ncbi:MAG: acetyl-CoA carboxylase biotin carboxyl carrier protein subunit [bacterium]